MQLSVQQRRTLSTLIEDAEQMVELYWDTDNGQKLRRPLDSIRIAFAGLEAFPSAESTPWRQGAAHSRSAMFEMRSIERSSPGRIVHRTSGHAALLRTWARRNLERHD